jgi:hypothetical protein
MLINEGQSKIPIFLEEMDELLELELKIENWLDNSEG